MVRRAVQEAARKSPSTTDFQNAGPTTDTRNPKDIGSKGRTERLHRTHIGLAKIGNQCSAAWTRDGTHAPRPRILFARPPPQGLPVQSVLGAHHSNYCWQQP